MASVTIIMADTPTGGVSIYTDFAPAVGKATTPAQQAALEVLTRTRRDWGITPSQQAQAAIETVASAR